MKQSAIWMWCLLGFAVLNQGLCRPKEVEDEYQEDGDDGGDYDEDEDEYEGPPPVIKSTAVNLTLDQGQVAFLPCDVEGNQNYFSRIWRKDSKGLFVGSVRSTNDPRINQLPNGTLEVRQVDGSDSGTYTCLISVSSKPQEVAHTLNVNSPAKITKVMPSEKSVVLKKASSITLECIAQGYPTPSIKWFKNDRVLEDQDPSIHGARYTIDNASMDDQGVYKCTATNMNQEVPDVRAIEIHVRYPPQITVAKRIVTTGEGYDSELRCTVGSQKKIEVKWYKDSEQRPISQSPRLQLERSGHDHILRIVKTEASDFGDYKCEAKNSEGEDSAVIRLTGNPATPILVETTQTDDESKDPVLIYNIESFAPIQEYELFYKKDEMDEWISVKPPVTPSSEGRIYELKHIFTGLKPGVYSAAIKAKNSYGWSELSNAEVFPREHEGDLSETGLLAVAGIGSSSSELRISLGLLVSLLVAQFYC